MTNFIRLIAEARGDSTFNGEQFEDLPGGGVKYTGAGKIIYWKSKSGAIRHRLDGPAYVEIFRNGNRIEEWWVDGKKHRIGKPAVINTREKVVEYWENGKRHRVGGPAYISKSDGIRLWYLYGQLHRTDGPAIENKFDSSENDYYVNGDKLTKEEFEKHFGED